MLPEDELRASFIIDFEGEKNKKGEDTTPQPHMVGILQPNPRGKSGRYSWVAFKEHWKPATSGSKGFGLPGSISDFTFYDNLYNTSVTVMEGVYDQAIEGQGPASAANVFFVQLGSFSKKESADSFRAEVILEGYMTSDVRVQSIDGYHRVVLGPFAYKEEAELAMNWANKRLFSSLLIVR